MYRAIEQFKRDHGCTDDDIEIHGRVIVLKHRPWWKIWS